MGKWKCEICNNEFDNFQAQGFNHQIYCPLCYFKELYKREKSKNNKAIEYIKTHKVSDTISFPLMKREEENQVKSCFDYEFNLIYKKELLEILGDKE